LQIRRKKEQSTNNDGLDNSNQQLQWQWQWSKIVEQQPTKVVTQQYWQWSMGQSTVTAIQCNQQQQQLKNDKKKQ